MKKSAIKSAEGNCYYYSDIPRYFIYLAEGLKKVVDGEDGEDYYRRKYQFLKERKFWDKEEIVFKTRYSSELIRQNLACLRQLLIEVTDSCNLRCKYCGYGEFYDNYDKRETKNQTFDNVKVLIDYLAELWNSEYNISQNNTISVGFYGGEPLVNMKLIKEVIAYLESLNFQHLHFKYNMTTNAVLLDKYMDYLVEKDFGILFSLDGNSYNSGYRVYKNGKPSFKKVVSNIIMMKEKYPDFFEKNVNFNSVLHNRSTIEEVYEFIQNTFGKIPRIAELNTNGVKKEKQEEFYQMFNSKAEGFRALIANEEIKEELKLESSDAIKYHLMLMGYTGNRYAEYIDLFEPMNSNEYIPTGTCQPFERKIFLTVNGKILPCERIGQENFILKMEDGRLNLDMEEVANYYSDKYKKVINSCQRCYLKRTCGQCLFQLKEKGGKLICPGVRSEAHLGKELSSFLTYAENNPTEYEELLSDIVID